MKVVAINIAKARRQILMERLDGLARLQVDNNGYNIDVYLCIEVIWITREVVYWPTRMRNFDRQTD